MIFAVSAALGALGLVGLLCRKTLLGMLIGTQLLTTGAITAFVGAGIAAKVEAQGHLFALLIALGGIPLLVGGYSLSIRLFYLKRRADIDDLRELRG